MAKTIKGIQTANEFSLRKKAYLDDREEFDTLADMASFDDVPDGFITLNKENGKRYEYNSSNLMDATLGKWKEYKVDNKISFKDYVANINYDKDDYIVDNNILYKATINFTSTDITTDTANGNLVKYVGSSYNDTSIKNSIAKLNKAVGDINTLSVVGVTDLVSAVNKLDLNFMQSLVYHTNGTGKKLLTITYKNGNTTDIDVSAIITSTNIGELANVNDTGIIDKQVLAYDTATSKYIPYTIDFNSVLSNAKKYTDNQIQAINHPKGLVVDAKPTITNNSGTYTITYIEGGVSKTTNDTNIWFYYSTGANTYSQTIFIDGVEITLSMNGSINLTDYVNKTKDLANGYTGKETDKTKVTTIKELDDLFALINIALGKKINTSDVIDDLRHTDIDKPLSANQGKVLKDKIDNISSTLSGSILIKKQFNNVTGGVENKFDSPVSLKGGYVSAVYSVKSGSTNLSGTLKEFNSSTKHDFIKNEDEVSIDDNGAKIKDEYSYNATFNTYYECEIDDFVDIISLKGVII